MRPPRWLPLPSLTVEVVEDHHVAMGMVAATRVAAFLRVSRRTVRRYVERGVLRGGNGLVKAGDVLQLEHERKDRDRHALDRRRFRLVAARVGEVRARIEELTRIWDLAVGGLAHEELIAMHRAAQVFVEHGAPPDSAATWAVFFGRLRQSSLAEIKRATRDPQPWRPFFRLYLVIAADLHRECGDRIAGVIEDRLVRLAREWMESTIGRRALGAAMRTAGGAPDRLLAREIRRGRRRAPPCQARHPSVTSEPSHT